MARVEIEMHPLDFLTVGADGPKGQRKFYLQAGSADQIVSLAILKEQARALSETLKEMLDELNQSRGSDLASDEVGFSKLSMNLREPIEPQFQIEMMGVGYDKIQDMMVIVFQEMVMPMRDDVEEGQVG